MTSSPPTLAEAWAEHAALCVTLATTPWDSLPAVTFRAWCVNATEALRTAAELLDAGVDQLAELTGDTAVEPEPVTYQPNPRLREWRTSTGTVWVLDDAGQLGDGGDGYLAGMAEALRAAAERGGATTALVFRDEVDLEQPEDHGLLPDPVDRHLAEAAAALAEDSALDGLAATVQDDRAALDRLRTGIRLELERAGLPTGGDDVELLRQVAMLAQVVAAARVRPVSLAPATLCGGPTDAGEGLVAVDLAGLDRFAAEVAGEGLVAVDLAGLDRLAAEVAGVPAAARLGADPDDAEDSTELFTEPPGMSPLVSAPAPSATDYRGEQDGAAA